MGYRKNILTTASIGFGLCLLGAPAFADPPLGRPSTEKSLAYPSDFHDDDGGCISTKAFATGGAILFDGLVYGSSALHKWSIVNAISDQEARVYLAKLVNRLQTDSAFREKILQMEGGPGDVARSLKEVNKTKGYLASAQEELQAATDKIEYLRGLQATDFTIQGETFQLSTGAHFPVVDVYQALGQNLEDVRSQQAEVEAKYPIGEIESQMAAQSRDHQDWLALLTFA